jgi:hypothetical protein
VQEGGAVAHIAQPMPFHDLMLVILCQVLGNE